MKEKEKSHGVQLLIRAVVRNPDGKIISDTGRKPSKSFVIQFLEALKGIFTGTNVNATDTSGNESRIIASGYSSAQNLTVATAVNIDTHGIQVGTGDAAKDNENYVLATQLTEGTGAGNITHGETVVETTAVDGANVDLDINRVFTNLTGSAITVKEAGMVCQISYELDTHLLIRDVLEEPVSVPDKCSLTIIYTLRTTV